MKLSDKQWEFLQDIARLIMEAKGFGYKLTGGELWRHIVMQEYYYGSRLSLTMDSPHRRRLAQDFNIFVKDENGNWRLLKDDKDGYNKSKPLGEFWESLNEKNRWGGRFIIHGKYDIWHFERRQ